ncbi:MAG: hypothetical protein Q9215_007216, partial [Flavoplaca cf. flavocitrina]
MEVDQSSFTVDITLSFLILYPLSWSIKIFSFCRHSAIYGSYQLRLPEDTREIVQVNRVEVVKMHLISTHRSFGAFLVLLVSAILLTTWSHGPAARLAKRQDTTEDTLLKNTTVADPVQSLGVHDYQHNLSKTHDSPILEKRARTLTYDAAVCKGRELYNKVILRAFNGQGTGARDYGENDINNGWTKEPLTRLIPSGMDEAFKFIGKNVFPDIGERIPTFEETKLINLVQDKDFTNSAGKKQK